MSWLGRLFGTQKAIDNLVDKDNGLLTQAGSWIGNMHYTEEEKAEATRDTREWGIRQLEALSQFKVVQRVMAFGVTLIWSLLGINIIISVWVWAITKETSIVDGVVTVTGVDAYSGFLAIASTPLFYWPIITTFGLYVAGGVVPESIRNKLPNKIPFAKEKAK